MDKEMNLEISRLRLEIDHLKSNDISLSGNNIVIFTIPDEIIELMNELDLPTIHRVLEVILFYSSYTGRSLDIEEVLYIYLEQYIDQESLYKAIQITIRNDLVNIVEESLVQVYDTIHSILFCGWTIKSGSINFYENYDILIRSERN